MVKGYTMETVDTIHVIRIYLGLQQEGPLSVWVWVWPTSWPDMPRTTHPQHPTQRPDRVLMCTVQTPQYHEYVDHILPDTKRLDTGVKLITHQRLECVFSNRLSSLHVSCGHLLTISLFSNPRGCRENTDVYGVVYARA